MQTRQQSDSDEAPHRPALYPLRFEPIFEYRTWGGRGLETLLSTPLPDGPVGEAWMLSDRTEQQSRVANGPLAGRTIRQVIEDYPDELMGPGFDPATRFPLLLKYLDARDTLSVQVHPSDRDTEHLPLGEPGKSEAWVVLDAEPDSRIYAGLRSGVTEQALRQALASDTVAEQLAWFAPKRGDVISIAAGTVHALGAGLVIFEPQQNSDTTFRLYDWGRVDGRNGKPRVLHVESAIACTDFGRGPVVPVIPIEATGSSGRWEQLIDNEVMRLWRIQTDSSFATGAPTQPSVLVCLDGCGSIGEGDLTFEMSRGDVFLVPAQVGVCQVDLDRPSTFLELELPTPR